MGEPWPTSACLSMVAAKRSGIALADRAAIIVREFCGMLQLQSAFGVVALLAIAWAFSEKRRAVSIRQAVVGLIVTLVTALVLIKVPLVASAFGA
ncbi:Na+ dependent nucleoside transporter N-terminal domain-containing protein, partial [Bradyrhizobium cenepequi]|uniref:Na+ dependent nucleoside transporter N-terminal domain-containing protein n=2 Tax=Bradyrhizobium cenepequi TaxID=2821403 RepID=UPI0035D54AB6